MNDDIGAGSFTMFGHDGFFASLVSLDIDKLSYSGVQDHSWSRAALCFKRFIPNTPGNDMTPRETYIAVQHCKSPDRPDICQSVLILPACLSALWLPRGMAPLPPSVSEQGGIIESDAGLWHAQEMQAHHSLRHGGARGHRAQSSPRCIVCNVIVTAKTGYPGLYENRKPLDPIYVRARARPTRSPPTQHK